MKCQKCETDMQVIDSRKRKDNRTRRRYCCPNCGERYTTTELITPDIGNSANDYRVRVSMRLAKRFVRFNGWTSKITGKTYGTQNEAVKDTFDELVRAMEVAE